MRPLGRDLRQIPRKIEAVDQLGPDIARRIRKQPPDELLVLQPVVLAVTLGDGVAGPPDRPARPQPPQGERQVHALEVEQEQVAIDRRRVIAGVRARIPAQRNARDGRLAVGKGEPDVAALGQDRPRQVDLRLQVGHVVQVEADRVDQPDAAPLDEVRQAVETGGVGDQEFVRVGEHHDVVVRQQRRLAAADENRLQIVVVVSAPRHPQHLCPAQMVRAAVVGAVVQHEQIGVAERLAVIGPPERQKRRFVVGHGESCNPHIPLRGRAGRYQALPYGDGCVPVDGGAAQSIALRRCRCGRRWGPEFGQ